MWACKKCGNTEIMMKEIETIEKVGRVNDNGEMEYERYKKTNKSIVYHCSICGAESDDLDKMCDRSEDMYVTYWYDELEKLHKEYAKKFKECKNNQEKLDLYRKKEERLYGLILKSSTYLRKSIHKMFEKSILKAIRNCQYRINRYRTYMTEGMPPKIFYINKNLEIGRCLVWEDPKDRWEFGQYKFSSKKSCEEWLNELKKYKEKGWFNIWIKKN